MNERASIPQGVTQENQSLESLEGLRRSVVMIRRRWRFGLFLIAVLMIPSYVLIKQLTPQFTAESLILIEVQQRSVVDIEAVLGGIGGDNAEMASQAAIIASRGMAARLVDEMNLIEDPEYNVALRAPGIVRSFWASVAEEAGLSTRSVLESLGLLPPEDMPSPERQRANTIDRLLSRLVVEALPVSFVLSVQLTSESSAKAASLVNKLADLYVLNQLDAKFQATQQASDWLGERLQALRAEVAQAETAITDYRTENELNVVGSNSLIESQLAEVNTQLTTARSERAALEARYSQMRSVLDSSGPGSVAEVLTNDLIQDLRTREVEALRELAELETRYGDLHPEIINARAELADLQNSIAAEVGKIIQNMSYEVDVARARETTLQNAVTELEQINNRQNQASVQLNELYRQAESVRTLYENMLARSKEVQEQDELQTPDARVISYADAPREASFPKIRLFLVVLFVASSGIAIIVILLLESLDTGVRTLSELESRLHKTGLAEVPEIRQGLRQKTNLPDYLKKHLQNRYAESLRKLRTSISLARIDSPPKIIAMCSALPAEGKSTIVTSLAVIASQGGHRVLVIDGDLRRPRVHEHLGIERSPGISELIAHGASDDEVIQSLDGGVDVVTAGGSVNTPLELLQSQGMASFVERMRERYDLIVIDTPALAPISDGLVLSNLADVTVMVVRWARTPLALVSSALDDLENAGAEVAGLVLSQVDIKKQSKYYSYATYGYYYKYYKNYYSS